MHGNTLRISTHSIDAGEHFVPVGGYSSWSDDSVCSIGFIKDPLFTLLRLEEWLSAMEITWSVMEVKFGAKRAVPRIARHRQGPGVGGAKSRLN